MWFSVRGMQAAARTFFRAPALLLLTEEHRLTLVAPGDRAPRQWVWAAFSGATPTLRQLSQELAKQGDAVQAAATANGFAGLRTVSFYFLQDQDEQGAYITAYAALQPEDYSLRQVHDELADAASWLRSLDPGQLFPEAARV